MIRLKSLSHYFPDFGTGCVVKVAHIQNNHVQIDTLVEGYAQMKPKLIAMEEDFLFDIASLTKTFTAILIHKAVERKLFALSDVITKIDERFIHLNQVTILDLLTHNQEIWTNGYLGDVQSKEEFYELLFHSYVKSNAPKYVDVHYMILAVLLETIYGLSYREIVKRDILEPLQLKNTVFEVSPQDKVVSCNYQVVGEKEVDDIVYVCHDTKARIASKYGFTTGHAGIFTTASDFLKILISLMDHKEILLKQETIDIMFLHDDYDSYLNQQILNYAEEHQIPMVQTCDTHVLLDYLLTHVENSNDFLSNIIKPYNYAGMRYQNPYEKIMTIPFDTSQHTVIFSGYTGPIYLMDFENHLIILVMNNVCHLSTKSRSDRSSAIIHMVKDLYEETMR